MGPTISEISFETIAEFWRAHLWPDRQENIRAVSSMLFEGDYNPKIRELYPPVFFGAFLEGKLVGVNSGHFTSKYDFRTRGLCVLPAERGRGIGRELLRATIEHAKQRDAATVWSYPRESAWQTYESMGFAPTGRRLSATDANQYAYLQIREVLGIYRQADYTDLEEIGRKKRKLDEVSPSFCLAKWKHVTVKLQSGSGNSCCLVKSHPIDVESLAEPSNFHNTPENIHSRKQMLAGAKLPECEKCWKVEEVGELSERAYKSAAHWAHPFYEEAKSGNPEKASPTSVEVSFDSICQFKCMYCSPDFSTSWEQEAKKFGAFRLSRPFNAPDEAAILGAEKRKAFTEAFWRWWPELAPSLRVLLVTGGEASLSPDFDRLTDDLIAVPRPNLVLSINTNLGLRPPQFSLFLGKLKDLRKSVKRVEINASIDSTGAQAEYIRFGLKEADFFANLRAVLAEVPGINVSIMVTVNALALPGLNRLMEKLLAFKREFPGSELTISFSPLSSPEHLSVDILPLEFLRYFDEALELMRGNLQSRKNPGFLHVEIQGLARIRAVMMGPKKDRWILKKDFYEFFMEYDRRRGTDFLATFPEFREFWEECRKVAEVTVYPNISRSPVLNASRPPFGNTSP